MRRRERLDADRLSPRGCKRWLEGWLLLLSLLRLGAGGRRDRCHEWWLWLRRLLLRLLLLLTVHELIVSHGNMLLHRSWLRRHKEAWEGHLLRGRRSEVVHGLLEVWHELLVRSRYQIWVRVRVNHILWHLPRVHR